MSWPPPPLRLGDGAAEALKWLAAVLMVLDHVNKYALAGAEPAVFAAGRLVLPIFACVVGFNLARPEALARGVHRRMALRLAIVGAIATVPFIALGGLGWGWWPLNVMFTLLVAVLAMRLLDQGGTARAWAAIALVLIGGAFVEYWWPGVAIVMLVCAYTRRPSWWLLAAWVSAVASLVLINRNAWALASFPVIALAAWASPAVPRLRWAFYAFYPAHLAALWIFLRLRA